MNTIQSVVIAIIEGLTEFLPISSTAHMKIANPLLNISNNAFTDLFEVVIQLAAILSVVTIYWKKFFNFSKFDLYIKLVIAVIPALIGGILLKKHIDAALSNLTFIACVMIGGGVILLFIDKLFKSNELASEQEKEQSYKTSFIIGCFQVLSIVFPGLSRSAATIIGGMSQKLTKKAAAEFSFFLAVPTMLAASAKSTLDVYQSNPEVFASDNLLIISIGAIVAFIVALLSVQFFIKIVQKQGFAIFGWYRIILGTTLLILLFNHWI